MKKNHEEKEDKSIKNEENDDENNRKWANSTDKSNEDNADEINLNQKDGNDNRNLEKSKNSPFILAQLSAAQKEHDHKRNQDCDTNSIIFIAPSRWKLDKNELKKLLKLKSMNFAN